MPRMCVCVCVCVCVCNGWFSHSVMSAKDLCPWDFPDKNTRVGCHSLLQGIFLTQVIKPMSPALQVDFLPLSHQGNPYIYIIYTHIFIYLY